MWYQTLHLEHSINRIPGISGNRQKQNTGICWVVFILCFLRLCLRTGNIDILWDCKQFQRCFLIERWSKRCSPGLQPSTNAVAKATAKSPQSYVPDCLCTSTKFNITWLESDDNRLAIWHCTHRDAPEYRLSYTSTSDGPQPIVRIVSQWPGSQWSICTNPLCWISNCMVNPTATDWNPLHWPSAITSNKCWAASTTSLKGKVRKFCPYGLNNDQFSLYY